ncbi:uncharacterized protein G2W53_034674 [Senna tora]|uniref:Uncharacterized protein n=1 Tax=Senna tora TaxID=362788 RepID=A0A834SZM9_9FABA|nr:uncharacterized protein G2W53_034674 [Senna tora]
MACENEAVTDVFITRNQFRADTDREIGLQLMIEEDLD